MKFNKELIDKFAKDLLFTLSEEENKMVLDEFLVIEENMEKINKLADILEDEPMTHPFPLEVSLRDDIIKDELCVDEVLQNATVKTIDSVIVPKVVDNE